MEGSTIQLMARTALSLGIVVGLIYLSAYLLKRTRGYGLARNAGTRRRVRIVESARLSSDAQIHLVEVDERTILVGVSRSGMSLLCLPGTGNADVAHAGADDSECPDRCGGEGGVNG